MQDGFRLDKSGGVTKVVLVWFPALVNQGPADCINRYGIVSRNFIPDYDQKVQTN